MENIREISPELQKKAEEELKETPEKIKSSLNILRDWIKGQPHLHTVKPTDQFLIAFLRGSKYNIEKCMTKINTYYTIKGTIPDLFGNRDPLDETIQEILKAGLFLPLKCYKSDSPKPVLARLGPYASGSQRILADIIKVGLMVIEILVLEDDNFTISGEVSIIDLKGIGLRLMMQWTPLFARRVSTCTEKALSVRFKGIQILNAPYGIGGLLAIFKMVFNSKIRNRIFVHNKDSLYDHIDKSVLPVEYGGTGGSVQELTDFWKAKVESYRDWFLDETAVADESKLVKSTGLFGFFAN